MQRKPRQEFSTQQTAAHTKYARTVYRTPCQWLVETALKVGTLYKRTKRSVELFSTAVLAALLYITLEEGREPLVNMLHN